MEITGHTRIYAILADPVRQVRTPEMFNRLAAAAGVDAVMIPLHVSAAHLDLMVEALRGLTNLAGFITTIPHKAAIVAHCDEISPAVAIAGAANAVRREPDGRLVGEILDGIGFRRGLEAAGVPIAGRRIFLAGAGGAASAIAFALAEAGAAEIGFYNRTSTKADILCQRLQTAFPALRLGSAGGDEAHYDILVNATALGMSPDDPLPFAVANLSPDQVVAEVVMKPPLTPLLQEARSRGCRTDPGAAMLDHQLQLMADFLELSR